MMLIPMVLFFALLFFGREDLGFRGTLIALGLWLALLVLFASLQLSAYYFIVAESVLDIGLVLIIFNGDIPRRT